jgi:hypothetical protein
MRHSLEKEVDTYEAQATAYSIAKNNYLSKEAERKHFESVMTKAAEGKSQAEKVMNAQATEEWLVFHKELARLEAIMDFHKLKLDVLDKEYQAAYLEKKQDEKSIRRQGA